MLQIQVLCFSVHAASVVDVLFYSTVDIVEPLYSTVDIIEHLKSGCNRWVTWFDIDENLQGF
jgi:hypothetical protein